MSARRYHKVESTIWTQGWDNDTVLFAVYLLTCDHRTTEGIYRLPVPYAATDLGWQTRKVEKHLGILAAAGFVEYDAKASVVLIVNALKRQAPNTNQATAAIKKLRTLPETYLRAKFYALAQAFAKGLAEQMAQDPPKGFGEGLGEWLGNSRSTTSSTSTSPCEAGLGIEVSEADLLAGDPGPEEGSNVFPFHDPKTSQERGVA